MEIDDFSCLETFRIHLLMREARLPARFTLDEVIEAMEKVYANHPNSWELAYKLGDAYQDAGRYADSIATCTRCFDLRPDDPRSRYALATAYRMPDLTTAQITEQCKRVPEPGLSLMISRHEARYWFVQAAKLAGPRSRQRIGTHIQALVIQYNHLFGRAMDPDFERYLDVRDRSIASVDRLEQHVTGSSEEAAQA